MISDYASAEINLPSTLDISVTQLTLRICFAGESVDQRPFLAAFAFSCKSSSF